MKTPTFLDIRTDAVATLRERANFKDSIAGALTRAIIIAAILTAICLCCGRWAEAVALICLMAIGRAASACLWRWSRADIRKACAIVTGRRSK